MEWFVFHAGQQSGPFTEEQMNLLYQQGQLPDAAYLWNPGMAHWTPLPQVLQKLALEAETGPFRPCAQCGRQTAERLLLPLEGKEVCFQCKPLAVARLLEGKRLGVMPNYAGFGSRFVARMIDGMILAVVNTAIQFSFTFFIAFGATAERGSPDKQALKVLGGFGLVLLLQLAAQLAYEVWFVSKKGATPGKMVLSLKITDADGKPLSTKGATGRFFAYLLSGFTLYIGYLLPLWDEEKRSLHDMICDSRVVQDG